MTASWAQLFERAPDRQPSIDEIRSTLDEHRRTVRGSDDHDEPTTEGDTDG